MSCIKTIALIALIGLTQSLAISQAEVATPAPTAQATAPKAVAKAKPKTKLKMAPNDTVIYVGDLHCKHCAKKMASKLYAVKGVVKVRTDLKADVAIVTPQAKKKLDPLALWSAAKKSGFPAIKLVGPAGTYVANAKTKAAVLVPVKKAAPKKS